MIEEAAEDDDDDTEQEGAGEPQSFDEKVLAVHAPLSAVVPGGLVHHFLQEPAATLDDLR
jgi:hypothetical protein